MEGSGAPSREGVEEILPLQLSIHALDDSQFVTLCQESGSHIRFQVDTGAQYNVIPLDIYKNATRDLNLSKITLTNSDHSLLRRYLASS